MTSRILSIEKHGLYSWVTTDDESNVNQVIENCTTEVIQAALSHLDGVTVVSVSVNTTGTYVPISGFSETDLPSFCDVRLEQITPGGHVVNVLVWVPISWNGRFLGTGGGGNRTDFPFENPPQMVAICRPATVSRALRNGFATALTDAGNRDPRIADWGLEPKTGELDWELIENWAHRSTHDMTTMAKAVVRAIHGVDPEYAYFQGMSGGGRQAIMEAQRYPDDYDGIWAGEPAINWTKFIPAEIWPALVMKESGNVLSPTKLEAFRQALIAAEGGPRAVADGFLNTVIESTWDPHVLVGSATSDGVISKLDADVMKQIWNGPTSETGERLWYGIRPGSESWAQVLPYTGLAVTAEVAGFLVPQPFFIACSYIGAWILRDAEWDWNTLTIAQFRDVFAKSVTEFADIATDDPDLSAFRANGGKLLISHAANDELIFSQGTVEYYERVVQAIGGAEETSTFARLFLTPGDGHCHLTAAGPGLSLAAGMTALMDWVENGHAPETILAEKIDPVTLETLSSRPASAYVSRLVGSTKGK